MGRSGDALYIDTASRNRTAAYQAGVYIVPGTDSMVGAISANAMHEELEQIENVADIDMVFQHDAVVYQAPEPPAAPALDTFTVDEPVIEYLDLTKSTVSNNAVVRYDRNRFAAEGIRTLTYIDRDSGETVRTELVHSDRHLVTKEWECAIPAEQTQLHAVSHGHRISLAGSLHGGPVRHNYPLLGLTWMQFLQFDARRGDVVRQQIRGRQHLTLKRRTTGDES